MYRNTLGPATRFAIGLLVVAGAGMLFWLGLLLDEEVSAFEGPTLAVLGLDIVCLLLSVLLFARVRWARIVASVVLHLIGLGAVVFGVFVFGEDDTIFSKMLAACIVVLAVGLSLVGILTLHSESMRADMARARDPQEERARRRRARRVVGAVGALVALSLAYVCWRIVPLLVAQPTVAVDYLAEANRLVYPTDYDPNLDAAPHYERLFADFVALPDDLAGLTRGWPTELEPEQLEVLRQWAPSNEAALGALAKVAQCPYWCYELASDDGALSESEVPFLSDVRQCAFAFLFLAKYRASQGDIQGAVDLLMDTHMMGVHRARGGTLLEQLSGGGICKICRDDLLAVLARCDVDVDTLKNILATLAAREPRVTLPRFAEAEHLYGYDSIQRIFTDDGRGSGRLIPGLLYETKKDGGLYSGPLTYLDALWICLCHPDRAETLRIYDRYWQAVSRLAEQSPWRVSRRGSSYEAEIDEMLADAYYLHDGYQATAACVNIGWQNRAESRAVATVLAVLIHQGETGTWPASLEDLVRGGYLQEVPMDPYSDGPFVYRVEGGNFVLYSVGQDFFDDGGVAATWDQTQTGGDRVFWPVDSRDPMAN